MFEHRIRTLIAPRVGRSHESSRQAINCSTINCWARSTLSPVHMAVPPVLSSTGAFWMSSFGSGAHIAPLTSLSPTASGIRVDRLWAQEREYFFLVVAMTSPGKRDYHNEIHRILLGGPVDRGFRHASRARRRYLNSSSQARLNLRFAFSCNWNRHQTNESTLVCSVALCSPKIFLSASVRFVGSFIG
jgi:hypothetical protein